MIKKAVLSVLAVGLVGGLVWGTSAKSYVKTAWNRVGGSVERSIPTDFQIERAEGMVEDLTPIIKDSMHIIAREEVKLEQLDEQIANREASSGKLQGEIMQLQSDLTSGKNVFRYAGHSYSRDEVEQDLSNRFARYKVDDETLDNLKQMRKARAANLDAARKKFTAMVSAQKKLQTDLQNLHTKRQLVEVAQASSDIVFDDSQLARAKGLIADIRTSLDVKARIANADVSVAAEIPLDQGESGSITDQVASYFHLEQPNSKVAAVSYSEEE